MIIENEEDYKVTLIKFKELDRIKNKTKEETRQFYDLLHDISEYENRAGKFDNIKFDLK